MANVCACGCGELLPENSTRQFKRGHKQRLENPNSEYDDIPVTDTFTDEQGETPLTIDQAAAITPDDPAPKDAGEYKPKTEIKITPRIRRDIEGKLALGFGMLGETLSMIDPLCGQVLVDNGPNMANKYTPILCQSPEVVRWMTRSGNFLTYINALMATWPVISVVMAHHVTHTVKLQDMFVGNPAPAPEYAVQ